MMIHNLSSAKGARKSRKRLGRGNASGHGTYSTRGQKGQRARSGGRKGLVQFGVKHFVIRMPKQRGFKRIPAILQSLDVRKLNQLPEGVIIDAALLIKRGLTNTDRVKIIGNGQLTKKLMVKIAAISKGARKSIIAAGGTIVSVEPKNIDPLVQPSDNK